MKSIIAWHFLPANKCLQYGDGREVKVGETLSVTDEPELCEKGLHASVDLLDALSFRRGTVLCRVKVSGNVQEQDDKICGQHRECLAMQDIERILRVWAIDCAEHVLPLFEKRYPDDKRVRLCIEAARSYLDGKITQKELEAARKEARNSYHAYADADADAAAAAAAYAAAYAAVDAAAYADAYAAAAADADARTKERDWQRAHLLAMLPASLVNF